MKAILIGAPFDTAVVAEPPAAVVFVVVLFLLLELHAAAAITRAVPRTINLRKFPPLDDGQCEHRPTILRRIL
jgi:hypothetical protein